MQDLISQLCRLYLPGGQAVPDGLAQHIAGTATRSFDMVKDGCVRAVVIPFDKQPGGSGEDQWSRLCEVAAALQGELGLPAPAVSISGDAGYRLWLSLEAPLPVARAQQFLELVCGAYCPGVILPQGGVQAPVELPPCLNQSSGKWAAFIHPGMGASFADELGLEMAPPATAQAAFLQGLQSISEAQLQHALEVLPPAPGQPLPPVPSQSSGAGPGLLLKDATLEDIVRFLHAKNIEPTFRHLLPARQ